MGAEREAERRLQVFRFGAGVFLLVQMIVIIATVYELNEYLVEKAEEGRAGAIALVLGTIVAFALAVSGVGVEFHAGIDYAEIRRQSRHFRWRLFSSSYVVALV